MSEGEFYIPKHADFTPEDIIDGEQSDVLSEQEITELVASDGWDVALDEMCQEVTEPDMSERRPHFRGLSIGDDESYDAYMQRYLKWLRNGGPSV